MESTWPSKINRSIERSNRVIIIDKFETLYSLEWVFVVIAAHAMLSAFEGVSHEKCAKQN